MSASGTRHVIPQPWLYSASSKPHTLAPMQRHGFQRTASTFPTGNPYRRSPAIRALDRE